MVSTSDRNRLFSPMAMMAPMKVEAMPVSVSVPMTMPTMAQAMPTGSAFLAPSASDSMQMTSVSRPPLKKRQAATSAPMTSARMLTPNLMKEAAARPSAIQNTTRKANGPMQRRERRAEDEHDGQRQAHRAGEDRRVAGKQQIDERGQRQHQRPVLLHRVPRIGQRRLVHALEAELAGFEMHHPEAGAEIEQRPG